MELLLLQHVHVLQCLAIILKVVRTQFSDLVCFELKATMSGDGGKKETSAKHKSKDDIRNLRIQAVVKKLGGQKEADEVLVKWEGHRRAEKVNER